MFSRVVVVCHLFQVQNAIEEKRKKFETLKLQDWIDLVRLILINFFSQYFSVLINYTSYWH